MIKVGIETHGCKLNQADSQSFINELESRGFQVINSDKDVDVYILNTCTVTHVADSKARNSIRKARRKNPKAITVVTGCYAERDPSTVKDMGDVDLVIGNKEKKDIVDGIVTIFDQLENSSFLQGQDREYIRSGSVGQINNDNSRTRAMLKIQEGCNQVCSYCIVPKVRGREVSVDPEKLIEDIRNIEKLGYREVVLTGTQLGSYGFEIPGETLYTLISRILDKTNIERIRVSSIQPQELTTDLLGLWTNKRLCPHFHVPLQSGNNRILKDMRRRYSSEEFIYATDLISGTIEGAGITTDVIVGFPGVTDDCFDDTYSVCTLADLSVIHVFPYSRRPGTSAYYISNQVTSSFKNNRVHDLMALARQKNNAFVHRSTHSKHNILWEKPSYFQDMQVWSGLTGNYIKVLSSNTEVLYNSITEAEVYLDKQGVVWAY